NPRRNGHVQVMQDADWCTTGEAARILGVTSRTVANWAGAGWLAHHTTAGGHRRFRREDVERFLADRHRGSARDDAVPSRADRVTSAEGTPPRRRRPKGAG